MTLNELFEHYLDDIDLTHQDTTIESIRYKYNANLKNRYGDIQLEDIDIKEVKQLQKDMLNGKIKTTTNRKFAINHINHIIMLLKRLLNYAIMMNYASFTVEQSRAIKTISKLVDKDKHKQKKIIWNIDDFNKFIAAVDDDNFRLLFNVLFYCGLRKGEALSLRWNDIDFMNQTITVSTTAYRIAGRGQCVKEPKSKCSHRMIYINPSLNKMLLERYIAVKNAYSNNINHLFVFGDVNMMSFSNLDRAFAKYKKMSNSTNMTLHGFRHSNATMLLEITNDVYNVSKRLGHENIEITDTYLHVNSKIQRDIAIQLENSINEHKENSYEKFLERINKMLVKEITDSTYKPEEMKHIEEIYNIVNQGNNLHKM